MKPLIFSCAGPVLSTEERDFFRWASPLGFILFARNVDNPEQLRTLIRDFREAVGRKDAPVLVDQEGGRVQRLRSPHWHEAPSFGKIGALYQIEPEKGRQAARLATRLIALDLQGVGITVDCSPCLDLSFEQTSAVIGDRSFHQDPFIVAELGAIVAKEFMVAGIIPVIKHMPGHGRGEVDSHIELPVVSAERTDLLKTDFAAFKSLNQLPWGMTAHIVFDQIDPVHPATQSPIVIEEIIRGDIGFDGLLLTDDLNMQALEGSLAERATRALDAGIDIVLHCSGILDEMKEVAAVCPPISDVALSRYERSTETVKQVSLLSCDRKILKSDLQRLLAELDP